jgi:4-amino-4-deoxy-L-arabinose transferase-like glycosyltransferase
MRVDWRVVGIWACFVARLGFYSSVLPLWEGYDEWAHFSVIRHMAVSHEALVERDAPVPRDVEASLQLAPVPWEMRYLPPPWLTQDAYWSVPAEMRARREAAFRTMPRAWSREPGSGPFLTYEALQPPLYYWMMTPVERLLGASSLAVQAMALRWLSVLLASLAIPLVFAVARPALGEPLALGSAAIVALMPGVALDVARVGNDGLSMVLFSVLAWLAVRMAVRGWDLWRAIGLGLMLGLGLLTKAYFLTAIPAFAWLWLWELWRPRGSNRSLTVAARKVTVLHGFLAAAIGAAMAGWWYLRNLRLTGTLSGLGESVMIGHAGPAEMLRQAVSINWAKAIDAILFSHLYFGGWSSLTVRSWMYHVFYVVIVLAAVGLAWKGRTRETGALGVLYGAFWAGQCYNVVLLYMSKGLAGSMGWYLDAVVAAEVVLAVAGLRRILPARAVVFSGAVLFALLDLYSMHFVAIPYYTGMIWHNAGGAVTAVHPAGFRGVGLSGALARLTAFKPIGGPVLVALWLGYLTATVYLVWKTSRQSE